MCFFGYYVVFGSVVVYVIDFEVGVILLVEIGCGNFVMWWLVVLEVEVMQVFVCSLVLLQVMQEMGVVFYCYRILC